LACVANALLFGEQGGGLHVSSSAVEAAVLGSSPSGFANSLGSPAATPLGASSAGVPAIGAGAGVRPPWDTASLSVEYLEFLVCTFLVCGPQRRGAGGADRTLLSPCLHRSTSMVTHLLHTTTTW